MSHKEKLHVKSTITILESLSKEYMKSVTDYENTKINNGYIQLPVKENDEEDEMFSDCIYMN
jgi:hypothetical protein